MHRTVAGAKMSWSIPSHSRTEKHDKRRVILAVPLYMLVLLFCLCYFQCFPVKLLHTDENHVEDIRLYSHRQLQIVTLVVAIVTDKTLSDKNVSRYRFLEQDTPRTISLQVQ